MEDLGYFLVSPYLVNLNIPRSSRPTFIILHMWDVYEYGTSS